MLNINLLAWVSSEYAVVLSAVCKVSEGVQDVIIETTDCVMMLDDFSFVITRKTSMGLIASRNCNERPKLVKNERSGYELFTNNTRVTGIFVITISHAIDQILFRNP